MRHERDPGPDGCRACNAETDRAEAKQRTLFERMAEAQRQRDEQTAAIRAARPGDRITPAPPKLDIKPAFTGAGQTSFKPARKADRFNG